MEKDDFKCTLSLARTSLADRAGGTWSGPSRPDAYYKSGAVPLMLDPDGHSVKRNFVHVSDLADAILKALDNPRARQETFNICMDEPVDYQQVADYLRQTRGLPCVEIKTPYHSTWLDNTKAKISSGLAASL